MDMSPIYELRSRLRTAAIAGTGLLPEDFRLKRAAEAMKPLEASSPVFAKIGQLVNVLLSPDCPNPSGALLDAITLTDAVICTLGMVEVNGDVQPLEIDKNTKSVIVNAPYSVLKNLLDALTTSGSGHYSYVCDTHETNPELFRDYRVKYALVEALGASYAELADQVEQWLMAEDETILPLLMKDFDPKGKKEMVRRVHIMETIAGNKANDFYIKMLENAEKEVRQALIHALRYEPQNIDLLLDMTKSEKGKSKQMALKSLAAVEDERAYAFFKKMMDKKPKDVLGYIQTVSTGWSSRLLAEAFFDTLSELDALYPNVKDDKGRIWEKLKKYRDTKQSDKDIDSTDQMILEKVDLFKNILASLTGKGGKRICKCYRELLKRKDKNGKVPQLHCDILSAPSRYRCKQNRPFEEEIGTILHHALVVKSDESLGDLALELYENDTSTGNSKKNTNFLAAAVTAKLLRGDACAVWLEELVTGKALVFDKYKNALSAKDAKDAIKAAFAFVFWDADKDSYMLRGYYNYLIQDEEAVRIERRIQIADSEGIIEWLMKHADKEMDSILFNMLPLKDEAQRARMGEWFYKRALVTDISRYGEYLTYMRKCGWTICKGLGVRYLRGRQGDISNWELYSYLNRMPGDSQSIREEVEAVYDMLKSGEIKAKNIGIASFQNWMESLK